jgi:diguanylate cyclase (GGDEF)-like protein
MAPSNSDPSTSIHCLSSAKLAHFLKRESRSTSSTDLKLDAVFSELLERANDFVPSEAGAIYVDDPLEAHEAFDSETLVVIAAFGPKARRIVDHRVGSRAGVVGEVYRRGLPYACQDPLRDPVFRSGPGLRIGFSITSAVGAPIEVDGRVIGVIEMLNHRGGAGYSTADVALLGIFAQTISLSIVNAIDAQRSKELAKKDELTDLFNDRFLHSSLTKVVGEALSDGSECGVIFLDLDHFKEVNDRHGHLAGSQILKAVGGTLKQIIPGDGIATRYGGDEFVIALPGSGRQETLWVAETIRQNIADAAFRVVPESENDNEQLLIQIKGLVTCSIGVATLQADVVPAIGADDLTTARAKDRLLRMADVCMYAAKEHGRNRTVPHWQLGEVLGKGAD